MRRATVLSWAGALVAVCVGGCGARPTCVASGGDWKECATITLRCLDGEVHVVDEPAPDVCQDGCTCPSEAPVWDERLGCIAEDLCTLTTVAGDSRGGRLAA